MATRKKLVEIVERILVEMYANAEPQIDFYKLVKEAEIDEHGEKIIDYDSYKINKNLAVEILNKHTEKLNKMEKQTVSVNVWLGCAPSFKKEE